MSEFKCEEPGCEYHVGISNGPNLTAEDWEAEQYYVQEIEEHQQMHKEEPRTETENRSSWEHCFSRVRLAPGVCVREYASPIFRRFGYPRVAEECANKCHDVLLNRLKQFQNSLRFERSGYVNSLYASGFEFHLHVVLSSSAGDFGGGHYCTRLTPHVIGDEIGDDRAESVSDSKFAAEKTSGVGETAMLVEVTQVSKSLESEVVPVGVGFKSIDLRPFEVCQEFWGDHFAQVLSITTKLGRGVRDGEREVFESRVGRTDFVYRPNVLANDMIQSRTVAVDRVANHQRPIAVGECGVRDSPLSQVAVFLSGIRFEIEACRCRVKFVEGFDRFYESCSVVVTPQELSGSAERRSTVFHDQQFSLSVGDAPSGAGVGTSESTERVYTAYGSVQEKPPAGATAEGTKPNIQTVSKE